MQVLELVDSAVSLRRKCTGVRVVAPWCEGASGSSDQAIFETYWRDADMRLIRDRCYPVQQGFLFYW
jgi:hypothetical protein